jgi:hypothetical protein
MRGRGVVVVSDRRLGSLASTGASVVAFALALGCQTAPPASSPTLEKPTPATHTLPYRVWLHPVEILDSSAGDARGTADAFTLNLHRYLVESQLFQDVRLPPGQPGPGDLAMQLLITRYRAERREHEMAAWGWWRIFGGPVYVDHAEFAGRLIVVDAEGRMLAEATHHTSNSQEVSTYDTTDVLPSAAAERTRFVRGLLDTTAGQLSKAKPGP